MKLGDLVSGFPFRGSARNFLFADIQGVSCSSKTVQPGYLFVAIRGSRADGHLYIEEAIRRGAQCVAVEESWGVAPRFSVPLIIVGNTRNFYAHTASRFFGEPSKKLNLIGITGTNGKTTTAFLIRHIIEKRTPCAIFGTLYYVIGDNVCPSSLTTPDTYELNKLFAEALAQDIRHAVMEVSSHALDQNRVGSLRFSSAVFTNLTRDHLDYHKDLETYFLAKRRLFSAESGARRAILNADDPYAVRIKKDFDGETVTYGLGEDADVRAYDIDSRFPDGLSFRLVVGGKGYPIRSSLLGLHNVYNILAASAETYCDGFSIDGIVEAVCDFKAVPGRMELVDGPPGVAVVVDYAHTPDAFSRVFSSVRSSVKSRVIAVFGCGGDRDRGKRPEMGRIASSFADCVILTSDNPRSEDPEAILDEIWEGIPPSEHSKVERIPDRRDAIVRSLDIAREGDVVLILGKGHETYQIIGDRRFDFSDQEVVRSYCAETVKVKTKK